MKIFTKHIVILTSVCGIISCTPTMTAYFWNGHYSLKKANEEMQKKEEEFYAKETIKQKELRKHNQMICGDLIDKKYPTSKSIKNGIYKRQSLYIDCMKERGSPIP